IQRVSRAIVNANELEVAKRIEGRKLWIEGRPVVVSPPRADVLISNRVRNFVVELLRKPKRSDQYAIAPAFIRIIKVRMKGLAFDCARIHSRAGKRSRQSER